MRKLILAAFLALASLTLGHHAHAACPIPNPNLTAPSLNPFFDGCQLPAVALNNLVASGSGINVKSFGATGNGTSNDAPFIRAACLYAFANGNIPIFFPAGTYIVSTPDGANAWGISTGTGMADGKTCNMTGASGGDYPTGNGITGPVTIKLGAAMNVPLLWIPALGESPQITKMVFDGNKSQQTGEAGGPAGDLWTVAAASTVTTNPETGPIFDRVVIQNGYNGNLYIGPGRFTWANRLWSSTSGQTTADISVSLNGFDSVFFQIACGSSTGACVYVSEGSQYQFFGGAIFFNGGPGLEFAGYQINYMTIMNVNFQYNTIGLENLNNTNAYPSNSASSVQCIGCTFDGNSVADVDVLSSSNFNRQVKLVAPSFPGNAVGLSGHTPTYNLMLNGANYVDVIDPNFGTANGPSIAWTDTPAYVICTGVECPPVAWTPTLGNGASPTYVTQVGRAMRNGGIATVSATVSVTGLGSPSGNMFVGNLPWFSETLSSSNNVCEISNVAGWTAASGYTWLSANMSSGTSSIQIWENGSTKTAQPSPVSEWAATSSMTVTCSYVAKYLT